MNPKKKKKKKKEQIRPFLPSLFVSLNFIPRAILSMSVIINKARRRNNFYLPVDELIKLVNRIKKEGNKRERQTDRQREREAGYECRKFIKSIRGRGRERGTPWRRIALRRKYIFLRSVTAPTYQGREAAQGSNCQLTVINSLSRVAAIKPAISPSSGAGPNDHRIGFRPIEWNVTRLFRPTRLSICIFSDRISK